MGYRIGIDIGGTKLSLTVLDDRGLECYRMRLASPNNPLLQTPSDLKKQYDALIATLLSMVDQAQDYLGRHHRYRLGMGTPGAINAQGRIKNANSLCLNARPFLNDMRERLIAQNINEVQIANDANCFALSEATDGAGTIDGQTVNTVFGVILGTGVGGGVVVRGQVLTGANAIAGEWGHNALPWLDKEDLDVPTCYCGKRGCVESWLSGAGLSNDHYRQTGERLSAKVIAQRAGIDETPTKKTSPENQTLMRYERRLAKSLAMVINVLDPDIIVLGGGLSQISRLYQNVPKLWSSWVFSDDVRTKLRPPHHGDDSGVRGAAWL